MRYRFQVRDAVYEIAIERQGDGYKATLNGQTFDFETLDIQPGQISLRFADRPVTVYWAADGNCKWLSLNGCFFKVEKPSPRQRRAASETGGGESVRAPMPAQVRALQVKEGEMVEKGQTLLLLEAMKMEIRIKAPAAGRIARLLVSSGQTVDKDQQLVEIDLGKGTG